MLQECWVSFKLAFFLWVMDWYKLTFTCHSGFCGIETNKTTILLFALLNINAELIFNKSNFIEEHLRNEINQVN